MTDKNQKLAALLGVPTAGVGMILATEQPMLAEVPPEVQSVVTNTIDTLPVLTGICLAVFSAGLAPWAARTTLSWLSSIMRGAI